jgi:hypothetical protein
MSPFLVLPRVLSKPLRWPIESARQARHNAYSATAALAVRRAEREEVDRFLIQHSSLDQVVPRDVSVPRQRTERTPATR